MIEVLLLSTVESAFQSNPICLGKKRIWQCRDHCKPGEYKINVGIMMTSKSNKIISAGGMIRINDIQLVDHPKTIHGNF
jgi:hypothetical protein